MPVEDRRIIFSNQEIYKALYALSTQKNIQVPPPGEITSVTVDQADSSKIYVEISNLLDEENPKTTKEYNRDFIAAALMLFCRGLGIPLPKSASKSVLISEGKVMLRVQI